MSKNNFNSRPNLKTSVQPMKVRDEVLSLCRDNVEPKWKRFVRFWLNKILLKRLKLKGIGEGCQLGKNSKVENAWLGNFSSYGPRCEFNGPLIIGDLTMLSSEVQVIGQDHDHMRIDKPMRIAFPEHERPITVVEADCWIGSRVTLMEGVRVGRGSIIGAASVVTKSIPPYSIAVGVPAKVIKSRFTEDQIKKCDEFLYGRAL